MRKTLIVIVLLALAGIGLWSALGGFERVTAEQSEALGAKARLVLEALAQLSNEERDVRAWLDDIAFLKLGEDG